MGDPHRRGGGEAGRPPIRIDAIMSGEKHVPLEERQRLVAQSVRSILDETADLNVDLGIENRGFQATIRSS